MSEMTVERPQVIRMSTGRKLLFSLLTVALFFAGLEGGLKALGMGRPQIVGSLQFGYEGGIPTHDQDGIEREGVLYNQPLFEEDPELFWRPIGPSRYTGMNGFRAPEPSAKRKRPHSYRFAVLGDSCSFLGKTPFPDHLAERMETALGVPVDFVNASCPGYTSFQGRRRAREVWDWDPNLLVVYFGWNDHWKSLNGLPDEDVMRRREQLGRPENWLQRTRICRTMRQLLPAWRVPRPVEDMTSAPVRVNLEQYRANVRAIVDEAERRGCKVVLITAPTAFRDGAMPSWAYGFFSNFYKMSQEEVDAIPRVHAQYCDVIRDIAQSSAYAMLLDAHSMWSADTSGARFRRDRIHLTEQGHEDLAGLLFEAWQKDYGRKPLENRINPSSDPTPKDH